MTCEGPANHPPLPAAPLTAENLEVARGGSTVVRVESLQLLPGETCWISAPSGAGKSTLMLALARMLDYRGNILLGGLDAASVKPHEWRAAVTLLAHPPVTLATGSTLREELLKPHTLKVHRGAPAPNEEYMRAELDAVGLDAYGLDHPTASLSQGELARVAFLRALLTTPNVLIMDEPTSNLDPASRKKVAKRAVAYASGGGIALIAGHDEPWESIDRRFTLQNGALVELTA